MRFHPAFAVAATIAATNYSRMTLDGLVLLFYFVKFAEFAITRSRNSEPAREIISAVVSYIMGYIVRTEHLSGNITRSVVSVIVFSDAEKSVINKIYFFISVVALLHAVAVCVSIEKVAIINLNSASFDNFTLTLPILFVNAKILITHNITSFLWFTYVVFLLLIVLYHIFFDLSIVFYNFFIIILKKKSPHALSEGFYVTDMSERFNN